MEEIKLINKDGQKLFIVKNIVDKPKGVVLIVHGIAEYCYRYKYLMEKLALAGYNVYSYDQRGHGNSEGERGYISTYIDLIEDLNTVVNLVKEENPKLKLIMLGHSMGGFVASYYGTMYQDKLDAQVLSGAATGKVAQVEGIMSSLICILAAIFPKMKIKNDLSNLICSDSLVCEEYKNDENVLKEITANMYAQFLVKGVKDLEERMSSYKLPCLILHGEKDEIVPCKYSKRFYENISSSKKDLIIYEGMYHEIFNEKDKDKVIKDVIDFLNEITK